MLYFSTYFFKLNNKSDRLLEGCPTTSAFTLSLVLSLIKRPSFANILLYNIYHDLKCFSVFVVQYRPFNCRAVPTNRLCQPV